MSEAGNDISALLAESDALFAVKRYGAAAERARDALRRDPSDPRVYCALALALHGEDRFAEAAQAGEEAIRLAPESAQGFRLRSVAMSSLARTLPTGERDQLGKESVASAMEAVRLTPFDPNSHLALAQALPLTGAIYEADRAIQEALRLAPNSASVWVTASLVALAAKNWNAAATASRRALEIEPENYAALNNLGVALRGGGHRRRGTRVLAEAARISPDSHAARQNLSRAGLRIVRAVILILLIPLLFLTHAGPLGFLILSVVSNVVISKNPGLALRLERVGAPVALFFAGKSRHATAVEGDSGRVRRKRSAGAGDQTWSATAGHSMYTVGNAVLIFAALAAWSVALMLVVGLVAQGPGRAGLVVGAVMFAALGALPMWVVVRRKRRDGNLAGTRVGEQRSPQGKDVG